MENQKKCFTEEHKETDAISYCPECRIYMCNKCDNAHSSLLKNHHHPYKLNKEEEIFSGYCKEKKHSNQLEFFCKNHNQLCCAACIAKLNENGNGQHKDCDVLNIQNIKDEKKNKLKENIKILEDLSNSFNNIFKELKEIFEKVEKNKEDLKLTVQKAFTKIRTALNEREDKLLEEIDNLFNERYFNEEIINNGEKLPKKIKVSLDKGKQIDKEWDNENLISYINDCINIENNIKSINIMKESINKYKTNNKVRIEFNPKEGSLNDFQKTINSYGRVYLNIFKFRECPPNINNNRIYTLSVENKNILTKTGSEGWMGTICEYELDKSIEEHKWKIKILNVQNNNLMVGVAPSDFDINSSCFNTCGWYYYCCSSTLYSGPPFNYSSKNTNLGKIDNEIILIMNMKKRSLKFIINGEDKGDSYTDIPVEKSLYPAVCLAHTNDSIEITDI